MRKNNSMLAGLLTVNVSNAPGRPPGVALRLLSTGGPQRATRQRILNSCLKEIVMKSLIIIALLAVGVLLQPPAGQASNTMNVKPATAMVQEQAAGKILSTSQMIQAQGAGVLECHEEVSADGDTYFSCCVNLWLFRLCFEVNWSAIERMLPF